MATIYSLVSIDKECSEYEYIYAVSYSKEILQNMIKNIQTDLLNIADFIIRPNTPIFKLSSLNENLTLNRHYKNVSFNLYNLYAFNKTTTYGVENVLLDITGFNIKYLRELNIFKNELSQNTIKFDIFYEEGIMNA